VVPVLGAMVASLTGIGATTATAAEPSPQIAGLQRVQATGQINANSVTVACPRGKRLIGTGAQILGGVQRGVTHVVLTRVVPNQALTSVTVSAHKTRANVPSFRSRAYAVCANRVAGLQRVQATGQINANSAAVLCPRGKRLLGTGSAILGGMERGVTRVALTRLAPNQTLTGDTVSARKTRANVPSFRSRAYAVCANPVAGLQQTTALSASNAISPKSMIAAVPTGKRVTGAGAEIRGGFTSAGITRVALTRLAPNLRLTNVAATAHNLMPGVPVWSVRAHAISAR